ncbi:MAG: HAD family hydrolase [Oscillospiraceae bacterium]|nr:HAD family hydrolase [Oscillospiraceae bacterium]
MEKDIILFDLDGTLTDSKPGIVRSLQYAMEKMGLQAWSETELECFIGPPLQESFREYMGLSGDEIQRAVAFYRERFSTVGIFENAVYPGIPELLASLGNAGKRLFVATSKPEKFARRILEHFELAGWFEDICGSELDGTRDEKAQVIEYCLEKNDLRDLSRAVMVGDRRHDVLGAHRMGLEAVGVLYGYGGAQELIAAGADELAPTVEALETLLQ